MPVLAIKNNPLNDVLVRVPFDDGMSIRGAIASVYPGWTEFSEPTLVFLNKQPTLRNEWDTECHGDDEVIVATLPAGAGAIAGIQLTLTLASLVVSGISLIQAKMLENRLKAGTGARDPAPVYTLEGKSNTAKLNQPIEVAYGKNRLWPSYVASPYSTYWTNRVSHIYTQHQSLFQLFCVGQGSFTIHSVQIEDTPIEAYGEVAYEVVAPGNVATLNPRITHTVQDIVDIDLVVGTSYGSFMTVPPGQVAKEYSFDLTFPSGLLTSNYEYIAFDFYTLKAGTNEIESTTPTTVSMAYTLDRVPSDNAFRQTYSIKEIDGIAPGRYLLKVRLSTASQPVILNNFTSFYDKFWPVYDDKTMLVVRYDASNILNSSIKSRINVIATRKLLTKTKTGSTYGSAVQPTSSIPWIIYDALTNPVYGGGLDPEFIDEDSLCYMHSELAREGLGFDYVFNQLTNVWDAITLIARAGRCRVIPSGAKLSLIRDTSYAIPMAVFSQENILPDSLTWNVRLFDPTEASGTEVTYTDSVTGNPRTLTFVPSESSGTILDKVELLGVTNTSQAHREAAYQALSNLYSRETLSFKTGLEGFIPRVGDVVALSWPMPKLGQSGVVEDRDGSTLFLSTPVAFTPGATHYILLRKDDGSAAGPYRVQAHGSKADEVTLLENLDYEPDFTRLDRDPVIFTFGPEDQYTKKIKITSITPYDSTVVEISATNYDSRVYAHDLDVIADDNSVTYLPGTLAVEAVGTIRRNAGPNSPVTIRWSPIIDALYYQVRLHSSEIALVYTGLETVCHIDLPLGTWTISVRAETPVGTSAALWWSGTNASDLSIAAPGSVDASFEDNEVKLRWPTSIDATGYRVYIHRHDTDALLRVIDTVATSLNYTSYMLNADTEGAGCRYFTFRVTATLGSSESAAALTDLAVPTPLATSSLVVSSTGSTTSVPKLSLKWQGDTQARYAIYADIINSSSSTPVAIHPTSWLGQVDTTWFERTGGIHYWAFSSILSITAYTDPVFGPGGLLYVPSFNPGGYNEQDVLSPDYFITGVPGVDSNLVRAGVVLSSEGAASLFVPGLTAVSSTPIAGAKMYFPDYLSGTRKIRGAIVTFDGWGTYSGDTTYFTATLP